MATRTYKLYGTGTGSAVANLTIGKGGRITSISGTMGGVNGADATGCEYANLSINAGTAAFTTSDTARFDIFTQFCGSNIASTRSSSEKTITGLDIAVQAGDRIYLHVGTMSGGTALSSRSNTFHIYVDETR